VAAICGAKNSGAKNRKMGWNFNQDAVTLADPLPAWRSLPGDCPSRTRAAGSLEHQVSSTWLRMEVPF